MAEIHERMPKIVWYRVERIGEGRSPPFSRASAALIFEFYFEHCGHSRLEVAPEEIAAWYAQQGWKLIREGA